MLALRLQRIGRRNEAHFKIVVIEKTRGPKSQKYVDIVGSYNPKLERIIIDGEKVKDWLSKGVQPSDTVYNMLIDKGIIEGKKKNVLPKKTPIVNEEKLAQEEAEKASEESNGVEGEAPEGADGEQGEAKSETGGEAEQGGSDEGEAEIEEEVEEASTDTGEEKEE